MIKKLSLFLSAIAIGILSIFGSISTNNTAEPQYFLENTQVKKAVVETNTNEYTLIFDNTIFNTVTTNVNILFDNAINIEIITQENTYTLNNLIDDLNQIETIDFSVNETYKIYYSFKISYTNTNNNQNNLNIEYENNEKGYYTTNQPQILNILGLKITSNTAKYTISELNNMLNPYIGTLEYLPGNEPIPPLEQINTLVSDIVNWFTSIFDGLGNVFYDPTANKLTAWGTVMFIGVAIMLISIALKWVISLIRGV